MSRVAVAAASQIAADAGVAAAENGGNAVDAAIAAAIASMCTDPGVIALGGGGFIAVCHPDHERVVIDCNPEMPGRSAPPERFGTGAPEVFMEYGGGMTTRVGHGSIATPGAVKGLGVAHQMFGEAEWRHTVEPTVRWAESGFPLSGAAAEYLTFAHEVIFGWHPESHQALHHPDGTQLTEGETVHVPGMADSLQMIATEGPDVLYSGELGRRMVEDNMENGGLLGMDDLAAYEAIPREPIALDVGEWKLDTNPGPAIGGATASAMVILLAELSDWSADSVADIVQAQDAVFAFRRERLDIAIDTLPEIETLLEQAETRQLLASQSTIHVSAVDDRGIGCSISMSAGYGSGATIPGTGIWLNNSLGEVELQTRGLHSIAPGTRLVSNMAPTVGRGPDGSVLAVGTPGASRITSALSLTILNLLRLGMSLEKAVEHPRLHVERFEGNPTVAYEPGIDVGRLDGFEHRAFPEKSMYFGGVQAALWTPADGVSATADSRRKGRVAIGG